MISRTLFVKLLYAGLLVVMLVSTPFGTALAGSRVGTPEPPIPDDNQIRQLEQQKEEFERAVRILEARIKLDSNGLLYLDLQSANEVDISGELFQTLERALYKTNEQLRSGKIRLGDVHFLTRPPLSETNTLPEKSSSLTTTTSCDGYTGAMIYWFGYRLYYDNCLTLDVIDLLYGGAGAATVCAATAAYFGNIPVAAVCGAATGLWTMGAAWINYKNRQGGYQGIYVDVDWDFNWMWIDHQ